MVVSDAYKVGLTLRFPRVERIRSDRAWYQTMTLSQVHTLRGAASGKLATRHYNLSRKHLQHIFSFETRLIIKLTDLSKHFDFRKPEILIYF